MTMSDPIGRCSHRLLWVAVSVCIALPLWGCGDDMTTENIEDTFAQEAPVNAQSNELNRLPRESLRPLPMVDEKGYPIDPNMKAREIRFVSDPSAYEEEENDPRFVRETGFRPINEYEDEENDPRFVRETGFMPAPIIRLLEVQDGVATVAWNPVPGAGFYEVEGVRFSMEGEPAESFDAQSRATRYNVNTHGDLTVITVVAVSPNGKDRSAQSNKLTLVPADP